jgi:hypothetical protein
MSSNHTLGEEEMRRNGKKGIRLWKEYFMCDLKLEWDWVGLL